jgi:hypothetical protein
MSTLEIILFLFSYGTFRLFCSIVTWVWYVAVDIVGHLVDVGRRLAFFFVELARAIGRVYQVRRQVRRQLAREAVARAVEMATQRAVVGLNPQWRGGLAIAGDDGPELVDVDDPEQKRGPLS